jgi:hypothetical protein
MRNYASTAVNNNGDTFMFVFEAHNWNGIKEIAEDSLAHIVAITPLHQKNGPWKATNIDVYSG